MKKFKKIRQFKWNCWGNVSNFNKNVSKKISKKKFFKHHKKCYILHDSIFRETQLS